MTEDKIGTITGTATFEQVIIKEGDSGRAIVVGEYSGNRTAYETEVNRIFVSGLQLGKIDGKLMFKPEEKDGWVWVEATKEELRITTEKP